MATPKEREQNKRREEAIDTLGNFKMIEELPFEEPECGCKPKMREKTKYCPNCGAKMDRRGEDEYD